MSARSVDAETLRRLYGLARDFHSEAEVCARAGAFRAGCVMLGAALEGMLLATAVALEPELRASGNWPQREPLRWDLGDVLTIAERAGWFPVTPALPKQTLPDDPKLGDVVQWVRWLRNVVHPGAFVRELAPEAEINENVFSNAYGILDAAFDAAADVLNEARERAE